MAKTKLGRDTEASPQQAFVDDPITLEPGSVAMTLTDVSSGATGTVEVEVPTDNGFSGINITSADGDDAGSEVHITSTTVDGEALVEVKATASGTGTATARLDANAAGGGVGSARVGTVSAGVLQHGIEATFTFGVGGSVVIKDGNGAAGDPGDVLTASATVGSEWLPPSDPLTSDGAIAISAMLGQALVTLGGDESIVVSAAGGDAVVTLGADGSVTLTGAGGVSATLAADGSFVVNGSGVVKLMGLPTADPVVAGQLWNDTGTLKVSAG